jgi:hypothetical protein
MPMPVSRTAKSMVALSAPIAPQVTRTTISPALVNLMALPTRLTITCRSRSGSPHTRSGTSGATENASARLRSEAVMPRALMVSVTSSRSEKYTGSRSSLRASILEKSRMSPMVASSDSAERRAISSCRTRSGSVSLSMRSCSMPRMPCSGVRISCDMLARNSLFAALASSARPRASRSSADCRSSLRTSSRAMRTALARFARRRSDPRAESAM